MVKGYAGARLGVGLLMILAPRALMRRLFGVEGASAGVVGRMLGVRDALLGAGALAAGDEDPARLRAWLTYGAIADAVDALAHLIAYRRLPRRVRFVSLVSAASGAATGAYLASRLEDASGRP